MKKTTVLLLICSISAFAQNWGTEKVKGNGNVISQTRETSEYEKIAITGSFDTQLIAGKEGKITLEGDENILDYIITEVEDNQLKIHFKKGSSIYNYKKILISIPVEAINAIALTGSGSVTSLLELKGTEFEIHQTGSGDMKLAINTKTLTAKLAGSGDLVLSGVTQNYNVKLAGSGNIESQNLTTEDTIANLAGSGNLSVFASNSIIAKVSGSGNINYKGNPKSTDKNIIGSGDITKI